MDERTDARVIHLQTAVHGRVLLREPKSPVGTMLAFHGYAETPEALFARLEHVPGIAHWRLCLPQALHRFYTRAGEVVASWMTKQDRELAIEDNLGYYRGIRAALNDHPASASGPFVILGFSQGAAMAYRAAALGAPGASDLSPRGLVIVGGDLPPELQQAGSEWAGPERLPPLLICRGRSDAFFTSELAARDAALLKTRAESVILIEYDGGHEWTAECAASIGRFISDRAAEAGQSL